MKIIHTIASLRADHGGPSRTVSALCTTLAAEKLDVELISHERKSSEPPPVLPDQKSVPTHLLRSQSDVRAFIPGTSRFVNAINERAGDTSQLVIHDHGIWLPTNHAVVRHATRKGWPTIVSPRGMLTSWAFKYGRWKKASAWLLYQKHDLESVTCFHATSTEEANDLRALGFRQPIAVIPNGVVVPDDCGSRLSSGTRRRVLFLSRIHSKKGLINLIDAWARVGPKDWELVIAGPDENGHRAEVELAIRDNDLARDVVIHGPVDDVKKWTLYKQADLFVLPTFSENFGVVIAEALASGLPVITTKGAPWKLLETHSCGWWIDIGVEPLAEALRQAMGISDEQRIAMGRRGRALVTQSCTWPAVAEQMKSVYEWVLGQGPQSDCIWDG